jgi:putative FmdB family regulatory protein
MPIYEYQCEACGKKFEQIQKFSDPPVEVCAVCGKGPVQRLLSSPAIQFKGEGWYITDYARKGKSDTAATSDSTPKSDSADTKKTSADTKSGTASEATPAAAAKPSTQAKD